jgi:hypothetical protein
MAISFGFRWWPGACVQGDIARWPGRDSHPCGMSGEHLYNDAISAFQKRKMMIQSNLLPAAVLVILRRVDGISQRRAERRRVDGRLTWRSRGSFAKLQLSLMEEQ